MENNSSHSFLRPGCDEDKLPKSPSVSTTEQFVSTHGTVVLDVPLSTLDTRTVGLAETGTPEQFRLLDCDAFLDSHSLRILQYSTFTPKEMQYAAVSYPWRDLQLPEGSSPPLGSFSVYGAEDADPITIGVLRTACLSARYFGASLLWLDRLCIMQSSKMDKRWQIAHMFRIYIHAHTCLVLPGGLVRLAGLDEPTTWIDRAWTLQEAAAGFTRELESVKCVFAFPYDSFAEFARAIPSSTLSIYPERYREYLRISDHSALMRFVIEPGHAVACDLLDLLNSTFWVKEYLEYFDPDPRRPLAKDDANLPLRIIPAHAQRLLRETLTTTRAINQQYLWISAFARTSSRPVDMIFSIMGLARVQLPVADFEEHERLKATIRLIQVLLDRGRPAEWLFIAPEIAPSPELSLLPVFPETSVSGRAVIRTPQGPKLAVEEIGMREAWKPHNAPRGSMSDDGYFTFKTRGVLIAEAEGVEETWGVVVGWRKELNRNPATGLIEPIDPDITEPFPAVMELTLMFVEKHGCDADGKALYHRIGMEREVDESKTTGWQWVERAFSVGGPGRGDRVGFEVGENGPKRVVPDVSTCIRV